MIARVCASVFFAVLLVLPPDTAHSDDFSRQRAVVEFLEVTGMKQLGAQIADSISKDLAREAKARNPEIPDEALNIVTEEVAAAFKAGTPTMMAHTAKLYEKYFTTSEMQEITAFYRTPAGQKTIQVLPKLVPESIRIGQQWAQSILPGLLARIKSRMAEKGYKL